MGNVKKPMEIGLLFTIDEETFHSFTKSTWIGDYGALCHITNDDAGLNDVTKINELVQGSAGNTSITKKGKLHMKVHLFDGSEWVHILWSMKYCVKVGVNLYSLTCELLQEKR